MTGHRPRLVRTLRAALYGMLALGMVGCYEIHEEVWIRDDGTVRYLLDYAVPEWVIVTASQVDGGNADSVLASMRRPSAMVVDGDSVWNRDFVDGDLRHFTSERHISSVERWIALAARGDALEDSIARSAARRDSIYRELMKGLPKERALEISDSLRQAGAPAAAYPSNPFDGLTGYVLGGYETLSERGATRIRHVVFPQRTRARLAEQKYEGDDGSTLRIFSGRTYSYRLHAPQILSTNGAAKTGDGWVEWSIPMADVAGDSVRMLDAVVSLGKR